MYRKSKTGTERASHIQERPGMNRKVQARSERTRNVQEERSKYRKGKGMYRKGKAGSYRKDLAVQEGTGSTTQYCRSILPNTPPATPASDLQFLCSKYFNFLSLFHNASDLSNYTYHEIHYFTHIASKKEQRKMTNK